MISYAPPGHEIGESVASPAPAPIVLTPFDTRLERVSSRIVPPLVPKIVAFSTFPIFREES